MTRETEPSNTLNVLCLKAFGDFTIAATAIEKLAPDGRAGVRLVVGSHLMPLAAAIKPEVEIVSIDVGTGGVPALFDLRTHGVGKAIQSAINLRQALRGIAPSVGRKMLVDRKTRRAQFVLDRYDTIELPAASRNIYHAYQGEFGRLGFVSAGKPVSSTTSMKGVAGVLPGSRIAAKNLPKTAVERVLNYATDSGQDCRLILVRGERPDLEEAFPDMTVIVQDFPGLLAAMRDVDRVVTADSLPAHLAERSSLPSFIVSPVNNKYWLPTSALEHDRWCLFENDDSGWWRLEQFVAGSN